MLGEIENDIEKFKFTLNDKDKQLVDLGKLLKVAKNEYKKVVKENKQLREYIITNRKKEEYRQQKTIIKKQKPQKYKKQDMNWKVTVKQKILNKIHQKVKLKRQKKNKKKTNNHCNMPLKKNTHTQQTGEKRKLEIFDYLNSEQDAKKNRN